MGGQAGWAALPWRARGAQRAQQAARTVAPSYQPAQPAPPAPGAAKYQTRYVHPHAQPRALYKQPCASGGTLTASLAPCVSLQYLEGSMQPASCPGDPDTCWGQVR